MRTTRSKLLRRLRELNVGAVLAQYDGCGDSGQIENPDFGSVEVPSDVATAVQDLFYECLQELYAGWELNEGSFGQFEWDIQSNRISLEHSTRTYETEEREL